jgi:glycosyltransferase involved in cell wall biosynthesis
VERYAKRLVTSLAEHGYKTQVFTGDNYLSFNPGQTAVSQAEGDSARYIVNYHSSVGEMVSHIEEAAKGRGIDILEVEGFYGLRSSKNLMQRMLQLPVPIVWTLHNKGFLEKRSLFKDEGWDFASAFSSRIDALICKSSSLADDAVGFGVDPKKIHVIYNAVDTKLFHPVGEISKRAVRQRLGLPEDKRLIMYLGRISPEKGSEFLMQAWDEIHAIDPTLHLVIVGDVAPNSELESAYADFKRRHEGGSVSFSQGFVADEQMVAAYYQASDIFLLPSPAEGLSTSVIEAMATGKPCVISDHAQRTSGVGDLIVPGYNGTTFAAYTSRALSAALHQVDDSMGRSAVERCIRMGFDLDSIARQHMNLYEQLIHGSPYSVAFAL